MRSFIIAALLVIGTIAYCDQQNSANKSTAGKMIITDDTTVYRGNMSLSERLSLDTMRTYLVRQNDTLKASAVKIAFGCIAWIDHASMLGTTHDAILVLERTLGPDSTARFLRTRFSGGAYAWYLAGGRTPKATDSVLGILAEKNHDYKCLETINKGALRKSVQTLSDSDLVKFANTEGWFDRRDSIAWSIMAKRLSDTSLYKLISEKNSVANYVPKARRKMLVNKLAKEDLWTLEYLSEWEYTPSGANWFYGEAKKLFLVKLKVDTTLDMYDVIRLWWKRSVLDDQELVNVLRAKKCSSLLDATKQLQDFNDFSKMKKGLYLGLISNAVTKKDSLEVRSYFAEQKEPGYLALIQPKSK